MSKEEFVKSYNLRRKDPLPKISGQSENAESNRKSKGETEKRKAHGKSENTVGMKKGSKDTDQNLSSGNIVSKSDSIKGDEIADKEENAGQNEINDDENGQEGQLEDIDTAPDSAYWTENDTDTLQERSESTALDDTEKDPNFDVEKEEQKNSEVTITADETNQDEEGDNAEVTPIIPKKRTKKSTQKTFVNKKPGPKKGKGNDEDEEDDFYYHCDKCSQKFTDWKKLQQHKLDCVKVPRKFTCSKCNRGFQQKTIMEQHFDFYHTKKPKKYVCNEHNKCYVYKKSYDEHLRRDHSDGNYRFMCDYCGKGFFHKSEFSIHRDSVHLKRKDYACNKCQRRASTSIGCLNAHLAICGKEAKEQCGICGKMYSTKETLFTHINDVHKEGVTRTCSFCDEKVYTSEGGYYKHMCVKHKISRNTIKLSDYMKAQGTEDKSSEEDENEEKDDADGDKKKNRNTSRKRKKEKDDESKNTEQRSKTENGRARTNVGSEDTDDMQPKRKRRKSHRVDDGKKSKDTEDDNKKNNSKDRKPKGNSTQTSEPVKSEVGKEPKGDSYPAKRTRSSGPMTWDCQFCEDKKYTDNLE